MKKIVVLDGYTLNPGDISWAGMAALGNLQVYDRTSVTDEKEILQRIGDAEIVFTNKTPLSKGVIDRCPHLGFIGVLATGYNVVDVKVTLYDGSYHEVDSSEMAFKIAGSMAFKEACKKADPVILEPIMKVSVNVPDEYMGTVIGDITARRGNILGQITRTGSVQIDANVPLAEMFGYATDLRSKTQGRGNYSMEPSHNAELPKSKTEEIVKSRGKD